MKAKLRKNASRVFISILALLMLMSTLLVVSTITATADTITLYYQANMPSGNYSASGSQSMTQSSNNTSKYYCSINLTNGTPYGYYIKWGNNYYKVSATASADADVLLYNYGSDNYGNSNHRVTFTPSSTVAYVFTFDTSNNKISVSPRTTSTVKLAWSANPGNGDYNMGTYSNMSHSSNGSYTYSMYMQKGTPYGMFIQLASSRYYKANTTLSTSGCVTLYDYGTSNYGDSSDRVTFTPGTGGYYTFTWNHNDKTLKVAKSALPYSSKTFKISESITDKWDSAATSTMSGTGSTRTFTYYLKNADDDIYFRFYNSTDSQIFGAETNNQIVSTSYSSSTRTDIGRQNSFYIDNSAALTDTSKFYEVVVTFDLTQQSNSGAVKYAATAKDNLTGTISSNKSSYNVTTGSGGITFTGAAANLFNSSNVTYQFFKSSDGGSTWTSVRSANSTATYTWTPTASDVGNYKFKVKVVDTTVNTSTNARQSRYVESSAIDISVVQGQTYTVNKKYKVASDTAVADGTADIGDSSDRATTLTFPLYRNNAAGTMRYKLTGFTVSSVTKKSQDLNAGTGTFYASASGGTITANYATEANYKKLYFKIPSGWSTGYAFLWKDGVSGNHNADWPGIQLSATAGAASGANTDDFGVCDFLGADLIQNGNTNDTYYYYKTYNTDYDSIIFDNGNGSYQTRDISLGSIQTDTASGQTYEANKMYYVPSANVTTGSDESGKWYHLPNPKYYVTISGTDTSPSYVSNSTTGSVTGTVSKSSVAVNSSVSDSFTITLPSGYTLDSTTPWVVTGGASVSGSGTSWTVTATADGTVAPNYVETPHTITVKQTLYDRNNTGTTSTLTTVTAGIKSTASIAAAAAVTDYTFRDFTLGNGVTLSSGSLSTPDAITVTAKTSGTYEVYKRYDETLYSPTVSVDSGSTGMGTIAWQSGSNSKIGNITYIQLSANNSTGYAFDFWEISPASGKTVTIQKTDGTGTTTINSATGSTAPGSGTIRTNAQLKFKMNGAATIKAHFRAVAYSISAAFNNIYDSGNSIAITDTSGNSKQDGNINDLFEFRVTLASGYEISGSPAFTTTTGYIQPTLQSGYPSTSGSVVTYRYKMLSSSNTVGMVHAVFTLKAKTPSLTSYMRQNTTSSFPYKSGTSTTLAVPNYYLQPVDVKATTDSFATIGYKVNGTTKNTGLNYQATNNNKVYDAPSSVIPATETGSATYTVVITASNAKTGVTTATKSCTITVTVTFNDEQKAYYRLKRLYQNSVDEDANTAETYYSTTAPWSAYQTTRETVNRNYGNSSWGSWPAYNATGTTVQDVYTDFFTKFKALQAKAKTTTIYVLSQYANSSSQYMSVYGITNGTAADYDRYKQYHYYLADTNAACIKDIDINYHHLMTYEGRAGSTYYLYSFTYAGKANAQIYVAANAESTSTSGVTLTGAVSGMSTIGNDYYINVYNTGKGASSVTSAADFVHLKSSRSSSSKYIAEAGTTYSAANIRTGLGLTKTGSLNSSAPSITINETEFTIQRNPGVDENSVNLLSTNWTPATHGRYKVTYKVKYNNGVDAVNGNRVEFENEKTYYVYVAYDEIKVYVDMNDNVGTPTLNFTYDTNKNLPYDMSLVSGSESIYEYTINLKTLASYGINYKQNDAMVPITINSISVDKVKYTNGGNGFTINKDAYVNESAWFKANSTSLSNFIPISCSTVTNTFRAIVDSSGEHIDNGIKAVTGTGIINDETDGIHKVLYAAYDNEGDVKYNFSYSVKATANAEVEINSSKYYFDRWMKVKAPDEDAEEDYFETAAHRNALVATGNEKRDYYLNSIPLVDDGDNATDGDGDYIYVAVYKPAATSGVARVDVTYKFKDYNTDDGNYVYDSTKDLKDATYNKIIKIPFGHTGDTYATFAAVRNAFRTIAKNNMPTIVSNYFDYSYPTTDTTSTVEITSTQVENHTDSTNNKIVVEAQLEHTVHNYTIRVGKVASGNTTYTNNAATGQYQQTKTLTASNYGITGSNVVWFVKNGSTEIPVHTGTTYDARLIQNDYSTGHGASSDTITIYVKSGSATVDRTSAIVNSYNEVYKESDTEKVRHNFYIIDYLNPSGTGSPTLVGAGALVATYKNGNYTYSANASVLDTDAHIKTYINNALKSGNGNTIDYDTERPQQTIDNISFRYIPYNSTYGKNTLRYSDQLKGYHYIYGLQNSISDSYAGQTLRVFSFFIYDISGTKTVVVSPTFAEISRNP